MKKFKKTLEHLGRTADNNREPETMVEITNSKQRRTLERIFETPALNNILWSEIESLFKHLGYTLIERKGSRIGFEKQGTPSYYDHRRHPQKEAKSSSIKDIRQHLENTGVTP